MRNNNVFFKTEKSRAFNHVVNEDRYFYSEFCFQNDKPLKLLLLCDGMGGLEDGEVAAKHAVQGFLEAFYSRLMNIYLNAPIYGFSLDYYANEVEILLIEAVKSANRAVCEKADPYKSVGTTLSAVCVLDNYAVVVNVGDSPIYFYKAAKKKVRMLSTLQTKAESDVLIGEYLRYSEEYYQNDHKLTHCLGQYTDLDEEDICLNVMGSLEEGDIFLIGSDGAFGRVNECEIKDLLDTLDCEEVLEELFSMARVDKADDQTAIIYKVDKML